MKFFIDNIQILTFTLFNNPKSERKKKKKGKEEIAMNHSFFS